MANTIVDSRYCCLTVQQNLDAILGADNPSMKERDAMGMMSAVTGSRNTAGFEAIQTSSRRGKALPNVGNRIVEVQFRPRQCVATTETPLDICDEGAASVDQNEYFQPSVDQVIATAGVNLDKDQFRQLCEEPDSRRQLEIIDNVNALKRGVNDALLASAVTTVGEYFSENGTTSVDSATNPLTLNLFTTAGVPNAIGVYPVVRQYKRMQTAAPIVIGSNTVDMWNYASPIFRGNVDGADITRIGALDVYTDYNLDAAWGDGDEHMLTWTPGYMQMLEWFRYEGVYAESDPNFSAQVLEMDGFRFDFSVYYDVCTQTWRLQFSKYFDLWNVPQEAFSADCGQLHNGILNWLVDCGAANCDYANPPAS